MVSRKKRLRHQHSSWWIALLQLVSIYLVVIDSASGRQVSTNRKSRIRFLNSIPTGLSIGSSCLSSLECLLYIPNSHCDFYMGNTCQCQSYHVHHNNTICLKASLLTFGCIKNEQCSMKVKNSQCGENGLCECLPNFMPFRFDKCLPPAKNDGYCLNDVQCKMFSRFSYCKYIIPRIYGKCRCPHGYTISSDGKCMPYLGNECDSTAECVYTTKNAQCFRSTKTSNGKCACKKGFQMSKNRMRCDPHSVAPEKIILLKQDLKLATTTTTKRPTLIVMRPTSLGQACNWTMECAARDPYSVCSNKTNRCECIHPTTKCSSEHTGCTKDTFQCRNGQCISWYFVCDGMKNCPDGSDEAQCSKFKCPKEAFQCDDGTCRSRGVVCNGKWECPDGSDEARCYKGVACDKHAFRCRNGQCVAPQSFCNAIRDCSDGSDEDPQQCTQGDSCPLDSFRCGTGGCRSTAILCSGLDGCGDFSDEKNCSVCSCAVPENTK